MTGKIKKAIASVLAVASLSTCAVGISASAATVTDSYSKFVYTKSSSSASCTLTNTTSTTRRGQVSMTIYTLDGTAFRSNDANLGNWGLTSCSYSGSTITGVEFYGTLYLNTQPVGNPISYWHKTL